MIKKDASSGDATLEKVCLVHLSVIIISMKTSYNLQFKHSNVLCWNKPHKQCHAITCTGNMFFGATLGTSAA